MKPFEYEKAESVEKASSELERLGADEARLIAGGTALTIMLKEEILSPSKLVDISKLENLREISYDEKTGLKIGSMCTHLEIESSPLVERNYPSLKFAFHTIGNVRVRAVGTIGGNLAYAEPQCNPPTILAALGAEIVVKGPSGVRSIPADDFIRGIFESALEPNEIITSINIPPPRPRSTCCFQKFTTKSETDKPTSTVAVYLCANESLKRVLDCRIVVGAVGPKTYRCNEAEKTVKGAEDLVKLDFASIAQTCSQEFEVMDDLYGPTWYKQQVTRTLIRELLRQAVAQLTSKL